MSTRSQKRKNISQERKNRVSESLVYSIEVENEGPVDQDVLVAGPSRAKSPRVESSSSENLRTSLKEEIISEIKNLLAESQRELLKMLKTKTGECGNEEDETTLESGTRSFYTPTKSVRIKSTQNNDPSTSRDANHKCSFLNKRFLGTAVVHFAKSKLPNKILYSEKIGFSKTENLKILESSD